MSQKSSILNSELAVKILSTIASRKEGDYSTNLADQLDKCQPSISRVLSDLHEIEFIEKGKREKAQYYTVNYNKIAEYWYSEIREKLEEDGSKEELEKLERNEEKIKNIAAGFFERLFESDVSGQLNLSELLFGGYMYGLSKNHFRDNDFMRENPFLEPVSRSLGLLLQDMGYCTEMSEAFQEAVEETKN